MFENGPSDRMQLRGVGELLPPGSCIVCGNGNCDKGYISPQVSLEWEGELYLCYYCVVQSAEIFGMMIPEEVAIIEQQNGMLNDQCAALRTELEENNERIRAYDVVLKPLAGLNLNLSDLSRLATSQKPESNVSNATDNVSGSTDGESESEESVKGKGPKRTIRVTAGDTADAGADSII